MNVTAAHAQSQGEGVTVAVVDSGVNGSHPDLAGNVLAGIDVSGAGAPNGLEDLDGHGTAMASLIAGHGHGNSDGVLGIAPHVKIFPVRDDRGTGPTPESIVAGVNAAVRSGAKVISISQGGSDVPALRAAIESGLAADAVVVAAMGNKPKQTLADFPASYDGVVAVGAIDQNGNVASVSVTGNAMVLSAPGMRIVSADKTGYSIGDGTSASTAIVAGAAALVRSKYPNLSAKEVVHRLTATATDKGAPGRDPQYGYGIVNLVAALTANVPPLTPSAGPSQTKESTPGQTKKTMPPANAAGQGNRKTAGSNSGLIVAVSIAVVLVAAGVVSWFLLRRRPQTPAT
ncbi:S8 family serine peptidase [Planosporangium thailandense]|uniref:S8 family serine peptidase n=1 Tax=Planosporangium thailandense TaxID=765197 RepID=A0ABX0XWB5_9ACTN|nr:S8 family serine peptidase [Planosporangium thailandense]NJC70336.1 S8 family serine peptidase [Planosporangium thailandense]